MPRAPVKTFNLVILSCVVLLLAFSVLMIYSATNSVEYRALYKTFYLRQILWSAIGLCVMFVVSLINYSTWIEIADKLYWFTVVLLILLLFFRGSMRWFHIGPFTFQPSELAKFTMPLALSRFILDNKGKAEVLEGMIKIGIMTVIPLVLIIIQPDLGTGLVFIQLFFCLLYVGDVSIRYLGYLITLMAVFAPVYYFTLMKSYQKARLLSFLNPESDPLGNGYSIIQSKIAVGSGSIFGKGFMKGTQSQLNFVPEHHTDFIFAVVGEEMGFLLVFILLLVYLMMILEGLKIAMHAKDKAGMLLASGVVSLLTAQLFMNIGMTIGILPVVGVPLPLLSYGGSSLLFTMALIGILLNVHSTIKRSSS